MLDTVAMSIADSLEHFQSEWNYIRGLTLDLLQDLSEDELLYRPCPSMGSFFQQFRHCGRVQENYLKAVTFGAVDFNTRSGTYEGGPDKHELLTYLKQVDRGLEKLVGQFKGPAKINWFGDEIDVGTHFMRLLTHETLHHGQFIMYCRLMERALPPSWSAWGE